jgi:hypothetical protein
MMTLPKTSTKSSIPYSSTDICCNTKIINNELIETKKNLIKWERVNPIKHA